MKRALLLLLGGALASACASAQAKAPADRPALEVPPPPPRAIEPMVKAEPSAPEPVGDLPPSSPPPTSKPRPAATREASRTEPKPPETATPPVEPAPTPPPAIAPAPQLRTPGSASGPEAAKQVRELLDRAQKALTSVNTRRLTTAQQGQYNYARLMLQQAEERLKASDFDIVRDLADKASRIAAELQGR